MKLINEVYQQQENQEVLRKQFETTTELTSHIVMPDFIESAYIQEIFDTDIALIEYIEKGEVGNYYANESPQVIDEQELVRFCSKIVGCKLELVTKEIKLFGWKNYTILHDIAEKTTAEYTLLIDLTPEWSKEYGGNITYCDGKGDYLIMPHSFCSGMLVKSLGVNHYVKYVNVRADGQFKIFYYLEMRKIQ